MINQEPQVKAPIAPDARIAEKLEDNNGYLNAAINLTDGMLARMRGAHPLAAEKGQEQDKGGGTISQLVSEVEANKALAAALISKLSELHEVLSKI